MAELVYNFLNNNNIFNKEDLTHYYLLWKVCGMTGREQTAKNVAEAYRKKFHGSIASGSYEKFKY
jgi:hypothetical protein